MAKFEDGSYGSFPGIELIAKVLAGRCKMHYTRVAVGKGYIEEGQTPKTMTEPAGYVMDAKISGYTNPVAGECQVTVQINSADVENGFMQRAFCFTQKTRQRRGALYLPRSRKRTRVDSPLEQHRRKTGDV